MVYQRRGGTFALRSGHANHLLVVAVQKQFGLRCDAVRLDKIVDMVEIDTGSLENQVVIIQIVSVFLSQNKFQFRIVLVFAGVEDLASVGRHNLHVGEVFAQETVGRRAFATKTEDDDFLVSNLI